MLLPTGIALGQIFYGPSLSLNYNDPTVDPRTPDIIVTPNVGVTYSGSKAKLSEHGGFAHDDTNVILLLSNPSFQVEDGPRGSGHRPGGAHHPQGTRHRSLGSCMPFVWKGPRFFLTQTCSKPPPQPGSAK